MKPFAIFLSHDVLENLPKATWQQERIKAYFQYLAAFPHAECDYTEHHPKVGELRVKQIAGCHIGYYVDFSVGNVMIVALHRAGK